MRNDPSDNGGLFLGRRPGSAPLHYRHRPDAGSKEQQRRDRRLAAGLAGLMGMLALASLPTLPLGWLFLAAQIPALAARPLLAVAIAFLGILLSGLAVLAALVRMDRWWILMRRAGGIEQRRGLLGPLLAAVAALAGLGMGGWLVLGGGLAQSLS